MKIAKGEYVTFLDGDDWFRSDALEIAYSEAKSQNTDITIFQIKYFDDETGVFSISFTDRDPVFAKDVVKSISPCFVP